MMEVKIALTLDERYVETLIDPSSNPKLIKGLLYAAFKALMEDRQAIERRQGTNVNDKL